MKDRVLLAKTLLLALFAGILYVSSLKEPDKPPLGAEATLANLSRETSTTLSEQEVSEPKLTANLAPISQLRIINLGIEAPMEKKGLEPTNKMEDPSSAVVVSWYDLRPVVDSGRNIVLAGHRELNGEPGVFWYLKELTIGDYIILKVGPEEFIYTVVSTELHPRDMAFNDIVGPTKQHVVTLITCEGTFIPHLKDYDQRRVVRAERADARNEMVWLQN